jgi:predicted GIY-YIG superfamily endonuclease
MRRLREPRNWVLVVELDDLVPRRDSDKPNLYVGLTIEEPATRYARLKMGYGPAWLQGHLARLRDDLVSGPFLSRDEARLECRTAIRCLKSEGYTVNRDPKVWTVYVIEMDPKGCKDPGKGFVYVGETSKTPEARYKEHIKGKRNKRGRLYSRAVRKYGQRLRMDLAPETRYFDGRSSKAAEKRWARKLKDEGYKVAGGH